MTSNRLIFVFIIALLMPINFISYAFEREEETKTPNEIVLNSVGVVKSKADLDPPSFSVEKYKQRIETISGEVEFSYNSYVRKYINIYTEKHRNRSETIIGRSTIFFPIFEQTLEKHGLPKDLKYLAVIESTLRPTALSKAGAKGLWQFMPSTGRQFSLEQNELVDERCDIYLATDAAARYLKQMNAKFDNWMLTIAAYNCGPGRVNKAIKRAGSRDIWKVYRYLPKETRGYVPAFISVAYMMNYYHLHEIYPVYPEYDLQNTSTLDVYEHLSLQDVADRSGVTIKNVRYLNPAFKQDFIPANTKGYRLILPQKNMAYFQGKEPLPNVIAKVEEKPKREITLTEKIYLSKDLTTDVEPGDLVVYEFQQGDNLWEVAKKYPGVTAKDIIRLNNILDYRKLRPGVQLLINPKA